MILSMNWMKTLKVRWRGSYQLTVAQRRCSEIYIYLLIVSLTEVEVSTESDKRKYYTILFDTLNHINTFTTVW